MDQSEKINIEHFDKSSILYDEQFGLSLKMGQARADFIRRNSQISLNGRVLDLGCGTGNLTIALLLESMATECVGLDISFGMLHEARRKSPDSCRVSFVTSSALSLPFKDGSFDYCVGDAFLHHILDVEACLNEVYRILKPGGMATFNEPSRDGYAFFETIIRIVMGIECDSAIDQYLHFLSYTREHQGDLNSLRDYPLPDKHFFSENMIKNMDTGFKRIEFIPALDPWPEMWQSSFRAVLNEIKPDDSVKERLLQAAEYIDRIIGDPARLHFCLHNQIFFYK